MWAWEEIASRLNYTMKIILYHTVGASTASELDTAVNFLLDEGYQLYGSPYLCDRAVEGAIGIMTFYQAMILDKQSREANRTAVLNEISESKEIKTLKMTQPNGVPPN
jgi:hypothetical protein